MTEQHIGGNLEENKKPLLKSNDLANYLDRRLSQVQNELAANLATSFKKGAKKAIIKRWDT